MMRIPRQHVSSSSRLVQACPHLRKRREVTQLWHIFLAKASPQASLVGVFYAGKQLSRRDLLTVSLTHTPETKFKGEGKLIFLKLKYSLFTVLNVRSYLIIKETAHLHFRG